MHTLRHWLLRLAVASLVIRLSSDKWLAITWNCQNQNYRHLFGPFWLLDTHWRHEDQQALRDAAEELARLRLTDAERTLIEKLTWPHPDPRMGRSLFVTPDERDIAVALLARHGGAR